MNILAFIIAVPAGAVAVLFSSKTTEDLIRNGAIAVFLMAISWRKPAA